MLAITIYLGFCMPTMCARKKHVFKLESTRVISILHPPVSRGRGKKGGSVGGRRARVVSRSRFGAGGVEQSREPVLAVRSRLVVHPRMAGGDEEILQDGRHGEVT